MLSTSFCKKCLALSGLTRFAFMRSKNCHAVRSVCHCQSLHSPSPSLPADYPDYGSTYYNNYPMKEEDERLAKNGTKYEEEEEEPHNEIDY